MMETEVKEFAAGYERTPEGYIIFPNDLKLRRSLFCAESTSHPAKMSLWLLQAIIDYVSEPGDILLDPMSGTGSLMMSCLPPELARSVVLIEDAPVFHYYQTLSKEMFLAKGIEDSAIILLQGPCQDFLPMADYFSHIIFSPPYSNVMVPPGAKDKPEGFAAMKDSYEQYKGISAKNLSRMPQFQFNQESARIYKMLFESLKRGGTMTIVIQDMMDKGRKNGLTDWALRTCVRTGFQLKDWFKRSAPGTGMKRMMKAKGWAVVEDEDVLILEKP